ncbi:MAG: J domain-containing protein [Ferruginibacter sp.]|nr:J domain-containing protein [Cytophagales bacterium]
MEYKDYYKILGVDKKASTGDIKKAYRKLAVKYHPDKNPGNKQAEEKFKEINEANTVLTDPEKRKEYDELGDSWKYARPQNGSGGTGGPGRPNPGTGGQKPGGDFEDLFGGGGGFSEFFESVFGNRGRGATAEVSGTHYRAEMEISLRDAYLGAEKVIDLEGQRLRIKFKPGIADGQVIKLKGKGGPGVGAAPSGDLLITVHVTEEPGFEREGDDLRTEAFVDVYTAVLGGKIPIQTLKGSINVTIAKGTDSGKVLRMKGLGMPVYNQPDQFGNLYVKVNIRVPKNLSEPETELFKQLAQLNTPPYAHS